jgi:adenosylcobinamide-GDP ribazoletransferase
MQAVRSFAGAVGFLTCVPVPGGAGLVAHAVVFFPLVGAAVGTGAGLVATGAVGELPPLAAGALGVGAAAVLTGGLHLDALADTADALGAATRERALEIMRDHAVGAFGATALIVVLVLDSALFGALAQTDDAAFAGLAAGAAGRAAMLLPALALPYAGAQEGQGRILVGIGVGTLVLAVVVAGLLALPAGAAGFGGLGVAALVAVALTLFAWRRFGGVTGDLLGATAKLAETAALASVAAVVT